MLRVVYRTVQHPTADRLVTINEQRGRLDVEIREDAGLDEVLQGLNDELKDFLARCGWFQIWRGRVISAASPDSPLTVQYRTDPEVDWRTGVQVRELGGVVRIHVCPDLSVPLFTRAINPALQQALAGGQWFQYWEGEIVTMDSAEDAAA